MKSAFLFFTGIIFILFLLLTAGCQTSQMQQPENPAAPGFNLAASDSAAIAIADSVMKHLGGRQNWDNTRYLQWRFFGRRFHLWDKWTGKYRLENKNTTVLMNLNSKSGRAWKDGREITQPDSLEIVMDNAYRIWINDSYWVFMPYKLKDSGVTLKYAGLDTTSYGAEAHKLSLTFQAVGVTPQNKYDVFVDPGSYLVIEWAYFADAGDEKPKMANPWSNWKKYGNIMLSDNRGHSRIHTDIAVYDSLDASVFTNP